VFAAVHIYKVGLVRFVSSVVQVIMGVAKSITGGATAATRALQVLLCMLIVTPSLVQLTSTMLLRCCMS
jgi:hypothetical protein